MTGRVYTMSTPDDLARDEATLIELGPRVADEFAFSYHQLGELKGDTETAVTYRAERAQEAAVKAKAEQEAAQLPPVAAQVALTATETRGLLSVLRNARMDAGRFLPSGWERYSSREVLDLASDELAYRLGWAHGEAKHATNQRREKHVQTAVDRYHQRLKATRTRRQRQQEGGRERER